LAIQSLTMAELQRLLKCAKASRERDWLMILVAFWHGLRATEVVGFTREAISDGFLTIQRLKGSLRTVQPLVAHANSLLSERSALIELAHKTPYGQPLFNISRERFWQIMQKHCRTAGIPAHLAHPHILKHSIAVQTIHTAGIENVRQHLGHKSMSSTGEYLRVSDEDASKAVIGAIGLNSYRKVQKRGQG
jgi:site-specific recombinase XerD